ncbi:MAG: CocE/NonD family hydrolase [Gemmatimonadetes bacterium]|nr:CocE/NonD family hydrolase [Gemmatimonadota bacterium]
MRPRLWRAAAIAAMLGSGSGQAFSQDTVAGYLRSTTAIAMRDGVKLHTVIWRPVGGPASLPILLERTPYDAESLCRGVLEVDSLLVAEGYLFVCQDLRGKYGSEGVFSMIRPTRDPKDRQAIDETTDAYDTMEWLSGNLAGGSGMIGMRGISYGGWTTMMALLDPHPAFKAASPQASPDDMFLGDDFHHNGALRLSYAFEYVAAVDGQRFTPFPFDRLDTYEWFLGLGGLANADAKYLHRQKPAWTDFATHNTFDDYWKARKVTRHITKVTVPTLTVAGWWDQEDFYGPLTIYEKMESLDRQGLNYLVVGPWNHGGWAGWDGRALGPIQFGEPTSRQFKEVEARWFGHWLKNKGPLDLPEALTFRPGSNAWQRHDSWPPKTGVVERQLYFREGGRLSWTKPTATAGVESFVSDPARPVPYRARPIVPLYGGRPPSTWSRWQVDDQRHSHLRPDVLSFETDPLAEPVTISGKVLANLFATTTGTDADWIVKLIDVYPEDYPANPTMAGYQLMVLGDVFRGRFLNGFERAVPLVPNRVDRYRINLHAADYTFLRGHRIMVQVQSTWFPLIDRNPQKFVPNIFNASDADYRAATHRVYRSARYPSHLTVSVADRSAASR